MSQFQLYRDARGEYRWRLIIAAGIVIATGGEGYTSRGGASIAIQAIQEAAPSAPIIDKTEEPAADASIAVPSARASLAASRGSNDLAAAAGEVLAQRFHETYERLAPAFGYQTREASAKPWADVPEQNRRLMVAVCAELLGQAPGAASETRDLRQALATAEQERDTLVRTIRDCIPGITAMWNHIMMTSGLGRLLEQVERAPKVEPDQSDGASP